MTRREESEEIVDNDPKRDDRTGEAKVRRKGKNGREQEGEKGRGNRNGRGLGTACRTKTRTLYVVPHAVWAAEEVLSMQLKRSTYDLEGLMVQRW